MPSRDERRVGLDGAERHNPASSLNRRLYVEITMRTLLITLLLVGSAIALAQQPPQQKAPKPAPSEPVPADAQSPQPRPPLTDDEKIPPSPLVRFMRTKLDSSNLILEGLCTDDMTKIDKGVGRLLEMSDEERWRVSNDVLYLNHSREFRRAVLTLKEKANESNKAGVALAWIDVTMNCIRCHSWVRDTIVVDGHGLSDLTAPEESVR